MLKVNLVRCQQAPFPTHQIQYPTQIIEGKQKKSDLFIDLWNIFIALTPRKITLPELDSKNFEV